MKNYVNRLILRLRKEGLVSYIKNLITDVFLRKKPSHEYPYIIQAIINKIKAKTYLEIGSLKEIEFLYKRLGIIRCMVI